MDLFEKLKEIGTSVNAKARKGADGTVKGFRIDITVGEPDENAVQDELETMLVELEEELEHLESLMVEVEATEPFDLNTAAHERWQARMNLIEEQIDTVEEEISDLEDKLEKK